MHGAPRGGPPARTERRRLCESRPLRRSAVLLPVRPDAPFHHIPVVALGLVAATSAVSGQALPGALYAAAATGAWAVYAASRLVGADGEEGGGSTLWSWVGLAILLTVASLGRLPRVAWGAAAVVALFAVLDAWRRTRPAAPSDAWAKPLLIAAGWTGGGVLLPLVSVQGGIALSAPLAWHAAAVFLAVAANAVLADAADRTLDLAADRETVATAAGEGAARGVGGALGLLGGVCAAMGGAGGALPSSARVALMAAPLAVALGALWLPRGRAARRWHDLAVGAGGLAALLGMG